MICYDGRRSKDILPEQQARFFDGLAVIMARQLRELAFKSLQALTDMLVPPKVRREH